MRWRLSIKSRRGFQFGWTVLAGDTLLDAIRSYEKSFPDRVIYEGRPYDDPVQARNSFASDLVADNRRSD